MIELVEKFLLVITLAVGIAVSAYKGFEFLSAKSAVVQAGKIHSGELNFGELTFVVTL